MNELKQFDQLAADITLFVAPTKSIKVSDAKSIDAAIEVAQSIKGYLAAVDKKRKELVGPLNAQVKAINDYCKQITAPLDEADTYVRTQLNVFAAEQARLARIEAERIERSSSTTRARGLASPPGAGSADAAGAAIRSASAAGAGGICTTNRAPLPASCRPVPGSPSGSRRMIRRRRSQGSRTAPVHPTTGTSHA